MTDRTTEYRVRVDWQRLAVELDTARRRRLMSLRAVAREMSIPHSALHKLLHGGKLSADSVARLVVWLYPRNVPAWILGEDRERQETTE